MVDAETHSDSQPAPATEANAPPPAEGPRDEWYVSVLAAGVSLVALAVFFRRGEILLYGDASAHIHIARRVFDSRTPGPLQLGTVWLPLPHLLILPFILSTWVWKLGFGASIPSMAAYVLGVLGVFRLVRGALPSGRPARLAAWGAALIYGANPNLLYLQATAMTEPLYLALFIWATAFFTEFVQATRTSGAEANERRARCLWRCAWVLFAAMMTRYDGWFAAVVFGLAAVVVLWNWTGRRIALWRSPLRPVVLKFVLLLGLAPLLWFAYNLLGWGNPLEFATGPYSARAIEARAERPGGWHYPGWQAPRTAATYFVKSAKLNVAGGQVQRETEGAPRWRLENLWFPLALLGVLLLLLLARGAWPLLLLWAPLGFYTVSISWGGVPIFLPAWWPYSYYNVRYGLQLLPALAVWVGLLIYFAGLRWRVVSAAALAAVMAFAGASYFVCWRAAPICLREAHINSDGRVGFERQIAAALEALPPGATVLAYMANHAAAFEFAGFPLRRTINESNKKPWPASLAAPGHTTDYVLAVQSAADPVWEAVQRHGEDLQVVTTIEAPGQPRAVIYRRR